MLRENHGKGELKKACVATICVAKEGVSYELLECLSKNLVEERAVERHG